MRFLVFVRIYRRSDKTEGVKELDSILKGLFDFQRFAQNDELQKLIDEVSEKYESGALSLDELEMVSAAGDPFVKESEPSDSVEDDT